MEQISKSGVMPGRLGSKAYLENFSDLHPPLDPNKAHVESDRCYFCYDAPCMEACPTSIDIPLFIRQISTRNPDGAAKTIWSSNILGGMCARVCPTETLCEEVCVHVEQGNLPVKIGELQRYATDHAMNSNDVSFERAPPTGKQIAIVGAGPAGLSCAHGLAASGHEVTIFEARDKPGGLNEYGLAAYKVTNNFAQQEVAFILSIGGIKIEYGKRLGEMLDLTTLSKSHDAVFLGLGLGNTRDLGIDGEDLDGVHDAVDYIADLRQAEDLSRLPVGRNIIVIGGGMTAIDIAIQTKKLGARNVTIVYRRGPAQMGASAFERELAQTHGVTLEYWAKPVAVKGQAGEVTAVTFERTELNDKGRLIGVDEQFILAADQVFKAIGQTFDISALPDIDLTMDAHRMVVDETQKTSMANVWAGGDCVAGGDDLTVTAVEDGKRAALAIDKFLDAGGA